MIIGETVIDRKNDGLERLCKIYLDLSDDEKAKVIRLAEGLLNSQKIISDEKTKLKELKTEL
jgi:hypothetical protein